MKRYKITFHYVSNSNTVMNNLSNEQINDLLKDFSSEEELLEIEGVNSDGGTIRTIIVKRNVDMIEVLESNES